MNQLSLERGRSLKLLDNLIVRHPTLEDIENLNDECKNICEDMYNIYLSCLALRPIDIADILWCDNNIWYQDLPITYLFVEQLKKSDSMIYPALKWFTNIDFYIENNRVKGKTVNNEIVELNEIFCIKLIEFIRQINFMPEPTYLNDTSVVSAQKYVMKQYRKKRNKPSKEVISLSSRISSLVWKSGLSFYEIWRLPIYAVHEGYMRLHQIDNWDKTMTAYYAGTIDTTQNKINFEKINFSVILNN